MGRKVRRKKNSKRKKILLLIVFVIIAVVIGRCSTSHQKADTRVIGYLPTWYFQELDSIDMSCLTHLNLAFINPDKNGDLHCSLADENIRRIVRKAHRHDVSVLAALGGGGGYANYTELISGKASMKEFNEKIIDYVTAHDMDGIDLNIEGDVEPEFWQYYDAWVKDLSKRCRRENLILSCAVASWFDKYITDETLDRFDFISVMAYDNKGDSVNHSTYDFAVRQLDYFSSRNIPDSKLVLGVPFYGYRYENGVCTGKVVTYREVAVYNEDSEYADESGTCRYNGISTITEKAKLSEDYGGIMIWCLGQDASGSASLLRAIDAALNE